MSFEDPKSEKPPLQLDKSKKANTKEPPEVYKRRKPLKTNRIIGQPAGYFVRFLALMIDIIIIFGLTFIINTIVSLVIESALSIDYRALLLVCITSLYFIILPTLPMRGTIGNYSLRIKIVRKDGSKISLIRSIPRFIQSILIMICITYIMLIILNTMDLLDSYRTIEVILAPIASLFICFIVIFLRKDKRAMHDLLTKTKVIKVERKKKPSEL